MSSLNPKTKVLKKVVLILVTLWILALLIHSIHDHHTSSPPTSTKLKKNQIEDKKSFLEWIGVNRIRQQFLHNTEFNYELINDNIQTLNKNQQQLSHYLNTLTLEQEPIIPQVDCSAIIRGDQDEITKSKLKRLEMTSKAFMEKKKQLESFDEELINRTKSCTDFIKWRKYINISLSREERGFPIAYIITIHKKVPEFERLLRAIYRPNNLYCVHVDKKSPEKFHEQVQAVTSCFDNVFVASNLVEVHYSHFSRVQADLNCLQDLNNMRSQVAWKYVINLCGQDYPLKTNYDIVKQLQMLYGANNLETITMPGHKKTRYQFVYELPDEKNPYATMKKTETKKSDSPLDAPMFAGSAYFIFSWRAVNFILKDPKVKEFLEWNQDTYSPDEHIWATLQRWHPFLPGSEPPHSKYDRNELISLPRLVKWAGLDHDVYPPCAGVFSRGVCVYGAGDLTWLLTQHHFFANKFDLSSDVFAVTCLDQWLRNRTIAQCLNRDLDDSPLTLGP